MTRWNIDVGHAIAIAMATVWLAFLYFPLWLVLTGDFSTGVRVASVGLTAVFAIIYIISSVVTFKDGGLSAETVSTWALAVTGTLTAIGLVQYALIGTQAATFFIFLVSISIFVFPPRIGLAIGAIYVAAVYGIVYAAGHGLDVVTGTITIGVYIACAGSVYFTNLGITESNQRATAAVLDERDRVARDVHDVLGHSLTVITLKSDLAAKLVDSAPEDAKKEMMAVAALSRSAISELRSTILALKIRHLAEELEHAREVTADAGIDIEVSGSPQDVDPRHRMTFAWALREAITNVLRHSGATSINLSLGSESLVVTDNGSGFGGKMGNGLRGLNERIDSAGGTLSVESTGQGTRLEVRM